mmetsp:Transcript_11441/g.33721  ORF Transcript_11441/g.33721 Transcript_11441/m.33721 type:complete len:541 (-) Transcript_11441:523-2145(-)
MLLSLYPSIFHSPRLSEAPFGGSKKNIGCVPTGADVAMPPGAARSTTSSPPVGTEEATERAMVPASEIAIDRRTSTSPSLYAPTELPTTTSVSAANHSICSAWVPKVNFHSVSPLILIETQKGVGAPECPLVAAAVAFSSTRSISPRGALGSEGPPPRDRWGTDLGSKVAAAFWASAASLVSLSCASAMVRSHQFGLPPPPPPLPLLSESDGPISDDEDGSPSRAIGAALRSDRSTAPDASVLPFSSSSTSFLFLKYASLVPRSSILLFSHACLGLRSFPPSPVRRFHATVERRTGGRPPFSPPPSSPPFVSSASSCFFSSAESAGASCAGGFFRASPEASIPTMRDLSTSGPGVGTAGDFCTGAGDAEAGADAYLESAVCTGAAAAVAAGTEEDATASPLPKSGRFTRTASAFPRPWGGGDFLRGRNERLVSTICRCCRAFVFCDEVGDRAALAAIAAFEDPSFVGVASVEALRVFFPCCCCAMGLRGGLLPGGADCAATLGVDLPDCSFSSILSFAVPIPPRPFQFFTRPFPSAARGG